MLTLKRGGGIIFLNGLVKGQIKDMRGHSGKVVNFGLMALKSLNLALFPLVFIKSMTNKQDMTMIFAKD